MIHYLDAGPLTSATILARVGDHGISTKASCDTTERRKSLGVREALVSVIIGKIRLAVLIR
jgi:hypothetical protein